MTGVRVPLLVRPVDTQDDDDRDTWVPGFRSEAARHLRGLLAVAPQDVYEDAVAALTELRGGPPG